MIRTIQTKIPDVLLFEPEVFTDERGFVYESFNKKSLANLGIRCEFVQDNHSRSTRNVLRGLHYQVRQPQGKLIRAVFGEIFDVAVDMRRRSRTFGQWVALIISSENKYVAWIPPGFAHGFCVCSEYAEVLYKTTEYYVPQYERCVRWDDARLDIAWPLTQQPILSGKDAAGKAFGEVEYFE